ncbi:hypothetical protein FSARC_9821 [Fusarium sarcochroum]|uniref:Uncharacterized protein n=1 Tax=Fusarium sarcochroum TaxID=1208366 RepID=A0A8H4X4W8_9HYPO|nr:hypothetical protein FSARC_9821 [Fusarium sarcochroum]
MENTNSISSSDGFELFSSSTQYSYDAFSVGTLDLSDYDTHNVHNDENRDPAKDKSLGTSTSGAPRMKSLHDIEFETSGKCLSEQSYRTFRRSELTRRALIHRQISLGRGDPSKAWCNDEECDEETQIFTSPFLYLINYPKSRIGLPVEDYFRDFADAMVTKLLGIQDIKAKNHKIRGLLSFIDSPPVRSAFWRFIGAYGLYEFNLSDDEFPKALVAARPVFRDIMFAVKTTARVEIVHSYINPDHELFKTWPLQKFILRFLICCEIWRQQKTPRSESWKIGSSEGVSQFLTAMLFNYKLMWREDCLDTDIIYTTKDWDKIWEQWLREYPVHDMDEIVDGEVFQPRDQMERTEEEVLEEVGYLGGVGAYNESYNPVQWFLGAQEDTILM